MSVLAALGFAVWLYWSNHLDQSPTQSQPAYAENEQQAEVLFEKGRYSEARPLFEQACAGGNGNACNHLGILYLDGFGVSKSSVKATGYYAKACDAGDVTGCLNLSGCYRDGTGVRKDIEKEKLYLDKACLLGDQGGCALSEKLSKVMQQSPVEPKPVRRTTISYGVAQGLLIQATPPVYPPEAKAAGVSGMVELKIIISKTGSVDEVHVVSGPAMLQQAAIDAVKQWRYNPYLVNKQPVEVETTVNVAFTL
jgi:TonB family protein